ncbi:MAG: CBS domain-containing protein [Azospirillum sp.]|nr:CBS domain-containing protein [Azospirillum sp.]
MPNRPVRDIIRNQEPITVGPEMTVRQAARLMREKRVGSVLVVEKGQLTGIFTERDALNRVLAAALDPDRTVISEVMTKSPQTISPNRPVVHALHMMHDGGFRHMPVVDGGRPLGMVSIRDAMGLELVRFEEEDAQKEAIAEIIG